VALLPGVCPGMPLSQDGFEHRNRTVLYSGRQGPHTSLIQHRTSAQDQGSGEETNRLRSRTPCRRFRILVLRRPELAQ
jgi:hypothetical protein